MERGPSALEEALGCTSAIIWVFDATGTCLLCTGGGLSAIGLAPQQFQGRDFLELYPEDTLPGTYIRRVLAGESFVTDYEREPGTVVQTSYHPRFDDAGTCVGAIALSVDVTHRREREDEGHRGAVLAQISRDLTDHARQSPEVLAQAMATTLTTHIGGTALVLEFDETGLFTDSFALAGPDPEVVEAVRTAVPLWRTLLGWSMGEQTLIEGKPVVISTLPPELLRLMDERLGAELAQRLQLRALMVAPTRDAGRVNGIMVVLRGPADEAPTDRECELLLEIADRAGLALANARLLQTAQQLTADRRALLGHLIDAEEGERRRNAHDIHDDTIQVLAAVDLRPVDGRDERVRKAAISFSPGEKGLVMVG
jgi:GAF domain-containing protein